MLPFDKELSYPVEDLLQQDEIFKKLFYVSKVLTFNNSKFYQEIKFDKNNDGALCASLTIKPIGRRASTNNHLKELEKFNFTFPREIKSDYIEITDADRYFNNDEISFAKIIINALVGKTNARSRVLKSHPVTISTADLGRLDSTFEGSKRSVETTSNNRIDGGNKVHVDISDHNHLSKIIFNFENENPVAMLYPKYQYSGRCFQNYQHKTLLAVFHFTLSKDKDEQGEWVYLLNVEKASKAKYNSYRKDFMTKVLSLFECADKYKLVTEQADEINSNQVPFDVGMLYSHFPAFYRNDNAIPFPSTPPHDNDNNNCNNNNATVTCGTKRQIDTELNNQGGFKHPRHQQNTEYPLYSNPAAFHSPQTGPNTISQDQQAYNQNLETSISPISEVDQISNLDNSNKEEKRLFDYLSQFNR